MKTAPDDNKLLWLSFCDATRPKGEQFLGVVIIEAVDVIEACRKAHWLNINPGGEIRCVGVPSDSIPKEAREKLLSKQDLEEFGFV